MGKTLRLEGWKPKVGSHNYFKDRWVAFYLTAHCKKFLGLEPCTSHAAGRQPQCSQSIMRRRCMWRTCRTV